MIYGEYKKLVLCPQNHYIINMNIKAFWSRVKTCIKEKAITQNEAALACGINPHTFRGWMSTDKVPPLSYAYKLAGFLGVSLEFLIDGKESLSRRQNIS